MSRTKQTPMQRDYCRVLLRKLITQVDETNESQSAREYSLCYIRGKTFSLAWWSGYENFEHVLIPSGTPINEKMLTTARQMMDKQVEELKQSFGRYGLEPEDAGGRGKND